MDVREFLRSIQGFDQLSAAEIDRVAGLAELKTVKAGQPIDVQGEPARMFGILVAGRLGVVLDLDFGVAKQTYQVAAIGPGEMFAWSGLVGNPHYTAGSKAITDCRYLEFDAAKLRALLDEDPKLGYVFMRLAAQTIASRLRHMQLRLVQQYALSESAE
uniref:Crp/Fnr family transcriptional regulator n=1 Tax=candidate division WOR-3 bacterium TaxID=2052148 RepID=A0A7C4GH15_UNCW3